jgi:DNA polymerase III subunit epsilon
MKVMYLDTETTGVDPKINDIVQLAAIIEIDGREMETFKMNCHPFDWNAVEDKALEVNRITREDLETFPAPVQMHTALTKVLGKYVNKYDRMDKLTIAGQKADFDAGFLREFFFKNGDQYYGSWFNYRHVDLLAVVRFLRYAGRLKIENDKLTTVAEYFGVALDAHDALEDIRATRELIKILIDRYLVKEAI